MSYAPYVNLAHSTLIANITYDKVFTKKKGDDTKTVYKTTFGRLFMKIDP